jgi:hypothetical protein
LNVEEYLRDFKNYGAWKYSGTECRKTKAAETRAHSASVDQSRDGAGDDREATDAIDYFNRTLASPQTLPMACIRQSPSYALGLACSDSVDPRKPYTFGSARLFAGCIPMACIGAAVNYRISGGLRKVGDPRDQLLRTIAPL